ncbi:MAG: GNAT family N-acetyltransferase [Bacteroidota bacterium]|nr:GNAT family N-acetyltransferase [Bacteroidota bacterium]
MSIEIKKVSSAKEMKLFIQFPLKLYAKNPYYVPALTFDEKNTFNPKKNPAFDFCEADCFLAFRDGKVVGRIAGLLNKDTNKWWKQEHARFGWFDVIDDIEVTKALIEAVENWAREKGMKSLKGPLGFCDLDPEGMLVEGYDQVGTFATIYNYPYYKDHIEQLGYQKDVDWKEFLINIPDTLPERYTRVGEILAKKYDLHMAKVKSNRDLVKRYGNKIFALWNHTYDVLYGFAPLTERQIKYYISLYLPLARLDLISLILDKDDEIIGFGIALPSLSHAFQQSRGKLFPFGFLHLLKAMYKNDKVDLYLMGVRPDFQQKGLISMIFAQMVPNFIKNGYKLAETNPELEHNGKIQALWSEFNPEHHKTRRVYIKDL